MKNPNKSHPAWNKGKDSRVSLVCSQCGCELKRYPSQIKDTNFCGYSCRAKSRIGVKRSKAVCEAVSKGLKGKKLSPERYKKFMSNRWNKGNLKPHTEETKRKISLANRKKKVKEFNGYIKSKDTLERAKFKREVQKLVLERDDYTCQICKKRGGKLQVDHIQSWADYVKLRFDIKNCRTLCMDCHYFITFGRRKPKGVITWGHNLSQKGRVGK